MNVIVDTCVWSLALRRNADQNNMFVYELTALIQESRAQLLGSIRQELLSGIKLQKQFQQLKKHLRAFEDIQLEEKDYELAAEYFNNCRQKGIQGSTTDFLICAVSTRYNMPILTCDKDFSNFQAAITVNLHPLRKLE
ncbi:MAG: PIN domain-containing protein [Methyloprofundus sp.]|nr:PIN domain-containing protein [Methyloprofundus sp.]